MNINTSIQNVLKIEEHAMMNPEQLKFVYLEKYSFAPFSEIDSGQEIRLKRRVM